MLVHYVCFLFDQLNTIANLIAAERCDRVLLAHVKVNLPIIIELKAKKTIYIFNV